MKYNVAFQWMSERCSSRKPPVTLTKYVARRLGGDPASQAINFFVKPFGALSYAQFWWYWNPVFGYYLYYHCYRPLRKFVPRVVAVFLTFLCCGLLHDMPFGLIAAISGSRPPAFTITVMFSLMGMVVIGSEGAGLRFERVPVMLRWVIHAATIYICWRAGLYLTAAA